MRVIGGEFRSRVLKSVPGLDTDAPIDCRESLFSILSPRIEGAVCSPTFTREPALSASKR